MQDDEIWISDVIDDDQTNFNNIFYDNNGYDHSVGVQDSLYYTEEEFLLLLKKNQIYDKSLNVISLNIANLLSKLAGLKSLLTNITSKNNRPHVIVVTETHLQKDHGPHENDLKTLIPGYRFFHHDRKNKGGGIGIFIDKDLCQESELTVKSIFTEGIFEGLMVTIPAKYFTQTSQKNLTILGVYRPPGNDNINDFLSTLRNTMQLLNSTSEFLFADLNLDLLKYELHYPTSEYIDIMTSHQMLPCIVRPTRIKHRSATLIDHIFIKGDRKVTAGILATEIAGSHGFTDHFPTFCIVDFKLNKITRPTFEKKFFTKEGHKDRRMGLLNEKWEDIYCENDPNIIYEILQSKYCYHYNTNITTKVFKNDCKRIPIEPWMTRDIIQDIRKRNQMFKCKSKRTEYKKLRNDIVKRKKRAEREYLGKKIDIHLYAIVSKTNFTCGKWKNITNIRVYKLVYTFLFASIV